MSGLSRRTVDNPPQGWRVAASSSVIAPAIPHDSVRRVPQSVMETGFVLYVEDNDDLRELVVELVTALLEHRGQFDSPDFTDMASKRSSCRFAA